MKKIFVNGTFDILHTGHLELLNYAKSLGDYLMVAIDTDDRVKSLKGPKRPVNNLRERAFMLFNLKAVNEVRSFGSYDELVNLVKDYSPDVIVKGSDHKIGKIEGIEYCKEVIFFDRIDHYSTTKKIESINGN